MPTLSRFFGIVIRMYFKPAEHNPPHIHVLYGEDVFTITIENMKILSGELHPSPRVLSMVREWISLHKDELLQMWETQSLHEVEPLQ